MSDNLGNKQPRVLEPRDKSYDSVVPYERRPPLSSELNLMGQIASCKAQDAVKLSTPSGWITTGSIKDTQDTANSELLGLSGDILTSGLYDTNTFKLLSKGEGVLAQVNGWVIKVLGTESLDDNNTIILRDNPTTTGRVDFIFLEVWRELIDKDSTIHPYGNTDSSTTLDNDILWDAIGVETSGRVQLQYRVRTQTNTADSGIQLDVNQEGFGNEVKAQGSNVAGNFTALTFQNMASEGDVGLWRAGNGSAQHQELLGTVDGYVYGIPMFAVYRRSSITSFTASNQSMNSVRKSDAVHSDRPDGRFLDVVHAEDIVDLRHKVLARGESIGSIAARTFSSLTRGTASTRRGKTESGSGFTESSGGSLLLKGEELGNASSGTPLIGSAPTTDYKRRTYANGGAPKQINLIVEEAHTGAWAEGDSGSISLITSEPSKVSSCDGVYSTSLFQNLTAEVTVVTTDTNIQYRIHAGSSLIGLSSNLLFQYTVTNQSSASGFKDVPESLLEVRDEVNGTVIATSDNDVLITGESVSVEDYLHSAGGNYTESHAFGHDLVVHHTLTTSDSINLTYIDGKQYGHTILGVKSVQRKTGTGSFGNHQSYTMTKTVGANTEYLLTSIGSVGETSTEVRITLYTSSKFFGTTKQGKGITDIYETLELTAVDAGGFWAIDSGDKPIIALGATTFSDAFGSVSGTPYAIVNGLKLAIVSPSNITMPVIGASGYMDDSKLPTKIAIDVGTFTGTDEVKVVVVVHSYITSSDSFVFYYKTHGYQGLQLSQGINGRMVSEGPALLTSEGSGAISNLKSGTSLDGSTAIFTQGSRIVTVTGNASDKIKPGDVIYRELTVGEVPLFSYRIRSVDSATKITLHEPYAENSAAAVAYTVERLGTPRNNVYGIVDRMPTLVSDDYLYGAGNLILMGLEDTVYSVVPVNRRQDAMEALELDILTGEAQASRGRSGFILSVSEEGPYTLQEMVPDVVYPQLGSSGTYRKVFQSYVISQNATGRLYLLIVGSESDKDDARVFLTSRNKNDVVGIFELIGRPLLGR